MTSEDRALLTRLTILLGCVIILAAKMARSKQLRESQSMRTSSLEQVLELARLLTVKLEDENTGNNV